MLWLTAIVFVGLLLVLVLAHEWGHYIMARKAGCRVEEFGFGLPPRIFSLKRGETLYSFNLFPIGGFVKIEGENMDDENPGPRSFGSKSAAWRVVILAAGVVMNIVVAWAFLSVQSGLGAPVIVTEDNAGRITEKKTLVVEVAPGSPAEEAGLLPADIILNVNGVEMPTIDQVKTITAENLGIELAVTVSGPEGENALSILARESTPENEGPLGVALASMGLEKVSWWQAPLVGLGKTWDMLTGILHQFGIILRSVVIGGGLGGDLTGPIGIAVYTAEVTRLGLSYILEFGALISINLAIINILPFPALDGGRILFVGIEKALGRRMPGKIEQVTHTVGFALLILLLIAVTVRDIGRFVV